jgi:hypothetical protein
VQRLLPRLWIVILLEWGRKFFLILALMLRELRSRIIFYIALPFSNCYCNLQIFQ